MTDDVPLVDPCWNQSPPRQMFLLQTVQTWLSVRLIAVLGCRCNCSHFHHGNQSVSDSNPCSLHIHSNQSECKKKLMEKHFHASTKWPSKKGVCLDQGSQRLVYQIEREFESTKVRPHSKPHFAREIFKFLGKAGRRKMKSTSTISNLMVLKLFAIAYDQKMRNVCFLWKKMTLSRCCARREKSDENTQQSLLKPSMMKSVCQVE